MLCKPLFTNDCVFLFLFLKISSMREEEKVLRQKLSDVEKAKKQLQSDLTNRDRTIQQLKVVKMILVFQFTSLFTTPNFCRLLLRFYSRRNSVLFVCVNKQSNTFFSHTGVLCAVFMLSSSSSLGTIIWHKVWSDTTALPESL